VACQTLPPSFQGFRIAHISDLHLGTYTSHPEIVERIVEMVSEASPDLIVFTGDIVSISPQELRPFTETLSRLQAPYGIVSILGNHDYCTYGPRKSAFEHKAQLEEVITMQRQMGWNLLMNEHIVLRNGNDSIAIIGVENDGHPPFPARANLGKATEGISAGCYKILLTHDPSHWRRAILSHTDIPLTLSGHTHAMHLRIGGWSPSALLFSEWGGLYKENNQYLHVNTGTGSNIPFRLGAWPEITIITLTSADAK
jgi:predicted MPP superfamily phosphohydrolase